MHVELRPISSITPYDKNPRRNDAAVDAVARSITEYGWRQPLVIDEQGVIVVGHTRFKAAQKLGLAEVPVHVAVGHDPVKARAYRIADNATAAIAEWDEDLLPVELEELKDLGLDLDLLGFDEEELAEWLGPDETAEDEAPEPLPEPVSRAGDLWLLGKHRLLCGDSSNREHVERVMAGERATLMSTDPPYGVDYAALVESRENQKKSGWADIAGDAMDDASLLALLKAALDGAGAQVAFVWHPAGPRRALFREALESNGWTISQEIVWVKNALVFGRSDYQWRHEPCLYAKRPGAPRQDDRTQTTVWEIDKTTGAEHPTQKPVELFAIPMRNHTRPGDVCFEPFSGSGSQIVAAEQLKRRCYAVELEPRYVDVALARWSRLVGRDPVLERTGEPFSALRGKQRAEAV